MLPLLGCGGDAPTTETDPIATENEVRRAEIEQRLITELTPAEDRPGRERNALINRAISQLYDVRVAPEGYFYEVTTPGATYQFVEGDIVEAHYTGRFLDGTVFDTSRKSGRDKLRFRVGDLIPAWNLAIQRVQTGASLRLLTPSALAYGAEGLVSGRGDTLVPAHTPLEFTIEEIEVTEE